MAHRSLRIGWGGGTAPFGRPTTTVTASPESSPDCRNTAFDAPPPRAASQGRVERSGPAKQATWVNDAGAVTTTVASSMGTSHPFPMAFQYSSTWSANPLSPPSTRYVIR